jgi:hypothetical protein
MSNPINYNAAPTISRFMQDTRDVRLLMGPYGSGKTTGCIMELIRRATMEHPNAHGLRQTRFVVVRNTAQQLRQTVLEDIRKWLQPAFGYKVTDSTLQFDFSLSDGTRVKSDWLMIPLDKPEDQQRLLSLNITGAWISEFREVPIAIVQAVLGRCGRFVPLGVQMNSWSGLIAESNPPDEDSEWYNAMEIETPPDWAVFKQPGGLEPNAENRQFLKPDYYEKLARNNTPDWVNIHVHGKYGKSLSGEAVFRSSFRPDFHVTYNMLKAIPNLPLMVAQDFGRTPASLITQMDVRGRLLVMKELTGIDMGIEQFSVTQSRPCLLNEFTGLSSFIIGDPAGKQKSQSNEDSPFDVLRRLGFNTYAAPTNDLDPRIRAVEQMLMRQVDGGPALLIDGGRCPQLVKTMKSMYKYKRKKAGDLEDQPVKDHPWSDLADCLQYACLGATGSYTARVMSDSRPRTRRPQPNAAGWT